VEVVASQAKLLEVVAALDARRRLADLLDSGQKEADEDGNDRDYHQQLDQREAAPWRRGRVPERNSS
jgi:hypothetical protein